MRLLLLLVFLAGSLVQAVPVAVAANGPGLNAGSEYEELVAQPAGGSVDQGSITITNVQCNPGGVSSFDLAASGTAYGPYPGTFEETATVTIGPSGELQSYEANFTIDSGDTAVHGTKQLYPNDPDRFSSGFCSGTYSPEPGSCDSFQQLSASTKYEATITRPSGSFTDYGVATLEFDASQPSCGGVSDGNFIQTFVASSITLPVPGYLAIGPSSAANEVGTSHTVTAYAATEDQTQTANDATVRFSVSGSHEASGVCITDFFGECTFTYQGPTFPGADVISAYVDVNNNGVQDAGEPTASATKEWVLPGSTSGQVSGSGQVGSLAFDFNARSDRGVLKGGCSVVVGKTMIKCLDVTSYVQSGNTTTVYGHARIDGSPTLYKITATDNGRPGAARDVFRIETSSGFTGGGVLTAGNVQVS